MSYDVCASALQSRIVARLPSWVDNDNCLIDSTNTLFSYLGSNDKPFGCLIQYAGFMTKQRRITTWKIEVVGIEKVTYDDTVDIALSQWVKDFLAFIESEVTLNGSVIRAQAVSGRKTIGMRVNDVLYGLSIINVEIDSYNAGASQNCA